jgi:hypothetical protein
VVRIKLPEGNSVVLAVPRSPAHRLLGGQGIEPSLRRRARRYSSLHATLG